MTKAEMAQLLALASAYDKRTVGQTDVEAWFEAIAFLGYEDAACAVVEYYTDETRPIMPADIRKRVRAAVNDRAMRDQELPRIPAGRSRLDLAALLAEAKARFEVVDDDGTVLWSGTKTALRARVLASPEARQILVDPPLSFRKWGRGRGYTPDPEVWDGHVPPPMWREQRNQSPRRTALLAACRAALAGKAAA